MITDLRSVSTEDARVVYDYCVVGAGPAGIALALALARAKRRVALLEGGGEAFDMRYQRLYAAESVGHQVLPLRSRVRAFGGATAKWSGRSVCCDAIDFQARDWVPHSGWPISLDDIRPFCDSASRLSDIPAPWENDSRVIAELAGGVFSYDDDGVIPCLWRFPSRTAAKSVRWNVRHREAIARSKYIRMLLHANVTGFESNTERGVVSAVHAASLDGARARIAARAFILCCGCIESTRLLLASDIGRPGGPANAHDQVGRYFMQHARGLAGVLTAKNSATARRLQDVFNVLRARSGRRYELGFALSPQVQEREKLLNCAGYLAYDAPFETGLRAFQRAARHFKRNGPNERFWAECAAAAQKPLEITGAVMRRLGGKHVVFNPSRIRLMVDLEQAPDPESRITLSEKRDALGQPLARIDCRFDGRERQTADHFARLIGKAFERNGVGRLEVADWLSTITDLNKNELGAIAHHYATTRMGTDPRYAVVDAHCAVFGVDNLYVAGSSVFPTGGHTNPTLTVIALSLRLAEHLLSKARAS